MRNAGSEDEDFRFQVYASTRTEEVAAWGWDVAQQVAFLHMQFELQQQSYLLRFPDACYRIVSLDGQPVGYLLFVESDESCSLVDIALLPDFRNLGIGGHSIRRLQTESGNRSMRLNVTKGNPAFHLYQRLGFRVVNEENLYLSMIWKNNSIPQ